MGRPLGSHPRKGANAARCPFRGGPSTRQLRKLQRGLRSPSNTVVYRWGVVGNKGAITQLQLNTPTVVAGIRGKVVQIATSNSDGYALTSTGAV